MSPAYTARPDGTSPGENLVSSVKPQVRSLTNLWVPAFLEFHKDEAIR